MRGAVRGKERYGAQARHARGEPRREAPRSGSVERGPLCCQEGWQGERGGLAFAGVRRPCLLAQRARARGRVSDRRVRSSLAARALRDLFEDRSVGRWGDASYPESWGTRALYALNSGPREAEKRVSKARSPSASLTRKFGWLLSRMINGTGRAWIARSSYRITSAKMPVEVSSDQDWSKRKLPVP